MRKTRFGNRAIQSGSSIPTIAYFDHTAIMSGGEIALFNLVTGLDTSSYRPVVILGADGPLARNLQDFGVEVHVLPLDPRVASTRKDTLGPGSLMKVAMAIRCARYTFLLARLLRALKVDLLHTNSLKADILGGVAGRMARVPVIWHIRDRIADDYLPAFAAKLFRACCHVMPDYILANSQSTMETLSTGEAVPSAVVHSGSVLRQLSVVHDGIKDSRVRPLQLSQSRLIIGLVGRISPWKGQHIFINAAKEVLEEFPQATFQIVGSAMFGEEEYEKQVRKQVKDLGIEDNIVFLGYRTDVPELISEFTMLVHASTTAEPFGQVVVEGMVAAKPVVATKGGGVLEIMRDGITGVLVPMGDSHAMAQGILQLLRDPATATKMGHAAREHVLQNFNIELTVKKVQEIYSEFLPLTHPSAT